MKGSEIIAALRKKLRAGTNQALSTKLGITVQAIHNWRKRRTVTARQIAGLVDRAGKAGAKGLQEGALRPLVEFSRIEKRQTSSGAAFELFDTQTKGGSKHPYWAGLRKELEAHHGVYIFFDSRGQAIYAGKARRQNLWREMKNAFNRKRGDIQTIKRVKHPIRKQVYRTSDEKARQIIDAAVPLHEMAAYFSAYQVTDGMINEVEAMLVRSFANDLLNKKMERFGQQKRKKKIK